jgi:DNA-binding GntR family transcriptional regulator
VRYRQIPHSSLNGYVLEAFLRLQAEGLLRLYPKRDAMVVPGLRARHRGRRRGASGARAPDRCKKVLAEHEQLCRLLADEDGPGVASLLAGRITATGEALRGVRG